MENFTVFLLTAFIAWIGMYFYKRRRELQDYPPGPTIWPLLGSVHKFGNFSDVDKGEKLVRQYGPIMGLQLGSLKFVVLSDYDMVKEAFANPIYLGKPDSEFFIIESRGKYGIISSDGETWSEQRRFAVRHLRDLGFGKTSMESIIMEEVNEFVDWLKTESGNPVDVERRLSLAVLNSIWVLLHGQRYKHDDPRLNKLFKINHEARQAAGEGGIFILVPALAKWFPKLAGFTKLYDVTSKVRDFFRESIEEHQRQLQLDQEPRDLVDTFLMEMDKQTVSSTSSFNKDSGMKNLLALNSDLFNAGNETTTSTLLWLFLYLNKYPAVQRKVHHELDHVVGPGRSPSVADKARMVYTEAVIQEVLRITSIVPYSAPHTATQDVQFHGYRIPKGTLVTPNIWAIHHNEKYFPEPYEFKPERFLSPDGTSLVKSEYLMPFSVGKRSCVGEGMARLEIFLFATNILNRFRLEADPAKPDVTFEHRESFILMPRSFRLVFKDRI